MRDAWPVDNGTTCAEAVGSISTGDVTWGDSPGHVQDVPQSTCTEVGVYTDLDVAVGKTAAVFIRRTKA
jgi:hypothetical protein